MKYKIYLSAFVLLLFSKLNAQVPNAKTIKYFSKTLNYHPLKADFLFVSETETSNAEYLTFLNWTLKNKGLNAYCSLLPDTSVWLNKNNYLEPYVNYYFRHSAYGKYPLVGISMKNAEAWCEWKTQQITESEDFKKLNIAEFIVRLPNEAEWKKAAQGKLGDDAIWPWPGNTLKMQGGKKRDENTSLLNTKLNETFPDMYHYDIGSISVPVDAYWPNTIGLYNICGNAAEWVQERKAMGGSWKDLPYRARIDYPNEILEEGYTSAKIGFRAVIEIISYKKNLQTAALNINAKTIGKQLAFVKDSLYASVFETSNLLYNTFLNETKCTNCSPQNDAWGRFSQYPYQNQYGWHPMFDKFPVVNISYESAVLFCQWLTEKYNNSKDRPFKKVLFKLPSKAEWELAARGGKSNMPYPWGGYYTRNSKGAYLANFWPLREVYFDDTPNIPIDFSDSNYALKHYQTQYKYPNNNLSISKIDDGYALTNHVDQFFQNEFGLKNTSGNVAEMLDKKGISKGGSFNSFMHFIQIENEETYNGLNATLGFRFFMQVIEK